MQIYSDIRSCWNFHEYHTLQIWSRGPLGCTTQADITLYISHIPDACIPSFIPLISPKHPPDITKISSIYPPKYIPQISPRYTSYIPPIYARYKKDTPKIYPQNIPIDMMMRLSSGHFWGGAVVGYPERDVGKKKKE